MENKKSLKRLIVVSLVVIGLLFVAVASTQAAPLEQTADAPWPMFRHDIQRAGRTTNLGPQTNNLLWTYQTGDAVNSSPAVESDGTIYVGSEDHNLYAINPGGTLKWTYTTGGGVSSSPAIGHDSTIYIGSRDHSLYGIYPDGTLRCTFATGGEVNASPGIGDDGTVYVGSGDGNLYALTPDCTLVWSYPAGGGHATIGPDGTIYTGYADRSLHALNPDGTLKWKSDPAGNAVQTAAALSPDGDAIYYGTDDCHLYARHTSDGSLKWTSPCSYGGIQSSPAIGTDGTVFVGTQYGNLWALNPDDGSVIWDIYMTLNVQSSPAIGGDGTIYFPTTYGYVYAVNPDGSVKWTYTGGPDISGHFFSSPAIGDNQMLYVGSNNGKLHAFGATLVVATPASPAVYPGDSLTVSLDVKNAQGLFAMQTSCTADPAILAVQNGEFGSFFDPASRFIAENAVVGGTWNGAVSLLSPAAPLFGDGNYAMLTYQAVSPGTAIITCTGMLSNQDGTEQAVTFVDASVTVLPFATLDGVASYQGRTSHADIEVTAVGPVTRSDLTDATGAYLIDQLEAGTYNVEADAPLYLPNCTAATLAAGDALTLPSTQLRGGDTDDNDVINIGDATLVAANFRLTVPPADPQADINGDGIVNILDLALLGSNYGRSGCQAW
ncbi:MAG: PQQ-binding-like beta-propeller repeat protein [Anaerolineae bacterium]|nr:PQQ-binding-like beta-propeller repeat protein [Anaerolineae bacterium]